MNRWGEVPEALIKQSTIMAVDDEPRILQFIKEIALRAGYTSIVTATDPAEVLNLYRATRPDLLLLDLHMPGIDGLNLITQIREESDRQEYQPIIIVTGDVDPAYRLRAILSGATDYLTKPIDSTELMIRVWNQLQTRIFVQEVSARGAA